MTTTRYRYGVFNDPDGKSPHLKGKRAMIYVDPSDPEYCSAQFDDDTLDEAYGWRQIPLASFTLCPEAYLT